ncbi:MAG: MATE family efflux transporter, partial [Oscillospiraceae bacterium]|nr:MATE family efflux transporter [Oscillospiraceae bacterium]
MLKPNKFIGDKRFYAAVIAVVLPIIIQNSITNFVSFLDNIMVGRIGTEQMSGVSIANQLIFVFNLCIFGGLSGPGIFGAQFYGQKNLKGVQYTFRFKLWVVLIVSVIGITVFSIFGPQLLSLYMNDTGDGT